MPDPDCLTTEELAAFHLGELPEAELARVAEHLELCPTCDEAARALDGLSDPTLTSYRQSALAGPLPDSGAPGRAVPGYEVLEELGRGGMGVVYKARDLRLRRVVALKMLLGGYFADREQRQRFCREAEAVARLQHPNIVQLFETGEFDADGQPRPYFTLEFVDGGSLADRLAGRPLPPGQAASWLEALARAVHHAHTQDIIHRDLKPSNVLLTGDGQPKVCDFGVAKVLSGSDHKTVSGMILGTAEYMAPEQADPKETPGPAADVYALGVILYEMLAGRPPFKGTTALDTLTQVRTQEPVPVRGLQPSVPRDLETICLKCLAKEPHRRYATAAALAEDLRRYQAHEPIVARPTGTWERVILWGRRRPAVAALTAAAVAALLLGAALAGWQWRQAVTERTNAQQLAGELRVERDTAQALAAKLEVQRDAAEWQTYRAEIAAAASALQLHNVTAARRHLDAAPAKFRNWEWRHFASQLDAAQAVFTGHTGLIEGLAFCPDGRHLVTAAADRTARLWDVATGKTEAVWHYDEPVNQLALRPDGTRLACSNRAGTVYLQDLTPNAVPVVRREPGRQLYFLRFSPDGSRLAMCSEDDKVTLRDGDSGADCFTLDGLPLLNRPLAFSPDSRHLAVGVSGGAVRLWDTRTGQLGDPMVGHPRFAVFGAFSPDGRFLVTASQHPDHVLRLWRVGSSQPIALLRGHTAQVYEVTFSPDGSRIASAGLDKTARLWDGTTGQPLATLEGHLADIGHVRFSPDGRRLVTASRDQTLRLWNVATGRCLATLVGHMGPVRCVAWAPDGKSLASAAADQVVRLWDLAAVERSDVLRGHTDIVTNVGFSPDGTRLLSASADGTLRLWDAKTGQEGGRLRHGRGYYCSAALSPDGAQAVAITEEGTSGQVWDLGTGEPTRPLPLPPGMRTHRGCAWQPAGTLVAAGGEDGTVHLWDAATGQHLAGMKRNVGAVNGVAFSPDGRQLASAGADGTICFWRIETRQLQAQLRGRVGQAFCVAYSADGALLASGGQDQTVHVWNLRTRSESARLRHDSMVSAVRFHPDGTRLAAGCADGTIRLWDLATGEEVADLRGHGGYVHALAFSPDGTRLASVSGDSTVRLWETIPPQRRPPQGRARS
jgi:WD40 repeat protein